jgi:hypothetical protein
MAFQALIQYGLDIAIPKVNLNKDTMVVSMKNALRYFFLVAIYLSGILIGGIYTPEVIAYAKQTDNEKMMEIEKVKKVKPPAKKRYYRIRIV